MVTRLLDQLVRNAPTTVMLVSSLPAEAKHALTLASARVLIIGDGLHELPAPASLPLTSLFRLAALPLRASPSRVDAVHASLAAYGTAALDNIVTFHSQAFREAANVTEPSVAPATEPAVAPVAEPAVAPATEPVVAPATEPAVAPVPKPALPTVHSDSTGEPVAAPATAHGDTCAACSKVICTHFLKGTCRFPACWKCHCDHAKVRLRGD